MKIALHKPHQHYKIISTGTEISLFDGDKLIYDRLTQRFLDEYQEECLRGGNDSAVLLAQIVTEFDSIYAIWRDIYLCQNYITYIGEYKSTRKNNGG